MMPMLNVSDYPTEQDCLDRRSEQGCFASGVVLSVLAVLLLLWPVTPHCVYCDKSAGEVPASKYLLSGGWTGVTHSECFTQHNPWPAPPPEPKR